LKANVEIFLKNKKYNITDGDLFFINAYDIHKIIYSKHSDYVRYVINKKNPILIMYLIHSI